MRFGPEGAEVDSSTSKASALTVKHPVFTGVDIDRFDVALNRGDRIVGGNVAIAVGDDNRALHITITPFILSLRSKRATPMTGTEFIGNSGNADAMVTTCAVGS
jgi:hypothetical protein